LLNYTIEDPNSIFITNGSDTTDANGEINFNINFSISYDIGFYHLNCSYNGTADYTAVWKLKSFQVRPILRAVNSTDINLKVNGQPVIHNYIQINNESSFMLTNYDTSVYDMSIVLKLNYTEEINYSSDLTYSNTFVATSDISYLTYSSANLTNYPSNFTNYHFNDLLSTSYTIHNNNFSIDQLIGNLYSSGMSFSIKFTYLDTTQVERIQITATPTTDDNNVVFREYFTASRTFGYWYFHNSMNISSVSLYHNRTATTVAYTDFTIENANYYFEKSSQEGDLFTSTTTYSIDWNSYVSYNIITNNGTYCEIDVTYQAPIEINNVTIVLDLTSNQIYAQNWTYNGNQSSIDYVLEIPNISFITTQQTFTITGVSSSPYASFSEFHNEDDFTIKSDYEDLEEWYIGYLSYPFYSQSFIARNINSSWTLDGIHYSGDEYDITSIGYFECPGWGTGISSSYLRFKTNPISDVERSVKYDRNYKIVVYRIRANLPATGVDIEFYIEEQDSFTIKEIKFEGSEIEDDGFKQIKLYKYEDRSYYLLLDLDLESGTNTLRVRYKIESTLNYSWLFLPLIGGLAIIGYIFWRFKLKNKEADNKKEKSKLDKILGFFLLPFRMKPQKAEKKREGILPWSKSKEIGAKARAKKKREKRERKLK
jgi:hypothetical protein